MHDSADLALSEDATRQKIASIEHHLARVKREFEAAVEDGVEDRVAYAVSKLDEIKCRVEESVNGMLGMESACVLIVVCVKRLMRGRRSWSGM